MLPVMIGLAGYGGGGKTTLADAMVKKMRGMGVVAKRFSLGDPVYRITANKYNLDPNLLRDAGLKDIPLAKVGANRVPEHLRLKTPRDLLIMVAEDARKDQPDIWLSMLLSHIVEYKMTKPASCGYY
jgi:hypothetical protein